MYRPARKEVRSGTFTQSSLWPLTGPSWWSPRDEDQVGSSGSKSAVPLGASHGTGCCHYIWFWVTLSPSPRGPTGAILWGLGVGEQNTFIPIKYWELLKDYMSFVLEFLMAKKTAVHINRNSVFFVMDWIPPPQNAYVEALTLGTSESDCIWRWGL